MTLGFTPSLFRICSLLLIFALVLANDQVFLGGKTNQATHTTGILRRFMLDNKKQREQILHMAFENRVDIWQLAKSHVDIFTQGHDQDLPEELINIPHNLSIIENTTFQPSSSYPDDWNLGSFTKSTFHKNYHPLFEIELFMQKLGELHPEIVTLHNIGHTAEGREMLAMTLSIPSAGTASHTRPGPGKLGFLIVGAQHAREWIATSAAMYVAHALVADESEPHSLRHLLNHYDFHIIPSPNPDGYTYTWETDRYWYKNRQVIGPRLKCQGVDMNRNWGYKWKPTAGNVPAASVSQKLRSNLPADPCSHWYPGHRAFEAPEVNNIANFVTTLPNLMAFLDLRSYGQMLSSPFSYNCKKVPAAAEDLIEAAVGATHSLRSVHGTDFETGSLCSLLYPAPGNIVDWMYHSAGIKYAYVAHLRDTGTYGFSLPPKLIKPVGEETAKMVDYLSGFISTRTKRRM